MAVGYVDVNMGKVSAKEWEKIRANPDYGLFGQYRSKSFMVEAQWFGLIKDMTDAPREFWTPFRLTFCNVDSEVDEKGNYTSYLPRKDPNLTGSFKTPNEMMIAYRALIQRFDSEASISEILESELDEVLGYKGVVPKEAVSLDEELLEDLISEISADRPSTSQEDAVW